MPVQTSPHATLSLRRRIARAARGAAYSAFALAFIALSLNYAPPAAWAAPGDDITMADLDQVITAKTDGVHGLSMITYTVVNTVDLVAKPDLSFTNTLPSGVTVYVKAATATNGATPPVNNCGGALTAVDGATTISWVGALAAGQANCRLQVHVQAALSGAAVNDSSNFQTVGINTPLPETLEVPSDWGVCPTDAFLFQNKDAATNKPTEVYRVNLLTGSSADYGLIAPYVNAVGFNQKDNYIWGWNVTTNTLTRINSDLTVTDFTMVTAAGATFVPPAAGYVIGDVDADGYMTFGGNPTFHDKWARVNLNVTPPVVVATGTRSHAADFLADWAQLTPGGNFYGVGRPTPTSNSQYVYSMSPSGVETRSTATIGGMPVVPGSWGAMYAAGGVLYASNNLTGVIWKIDVNPSTGAGAATKYSDGPTSVGNDGARCAAALLSVDYGDAPDSYGTTLASDGPRSVVDENLRIGDTNSAEDDAAVGPLANSDLGDDGVNGGPGYGSTFKITPGVAPSVDVKVTNNTGSPSTLAGWIDFNRDGDFLDAGEKVVVPVASDPGEQVKTLAFPTTPSGLAGSTYARFRIVPSAADPAITGPMVIGEVEDYVVEADLESSLTLLKNVVSRSATTDQFTISITGGSLTGETATTSGAATGIQAQQVGPLAAASGTTYTFSESAAGTTALSRYTTTWACVDARAGNATIANGAGTTFTVTPTPAQDPVCTFTNTAIPPDPTIIVKKNVVGRVAPGDQFVLSATGGALSGATATTSGVVTGVQAAQVGPRDATPGVTYAVSETASGTTILSRYTSTYSCIDLANANAVVAAGTGVATSFVMPVGAASSVIECTFTNTPLAPRLTLQKNVVERALPGDQFTLDITGGTLAGATATTTGGATGVQSEIVTSVTAAAGTSYTFTESAAGSTVLSGYSTTYRCVDRVSSNAVVATATGRTFNYTPRAAEDVVCTFINTPIDPTVSLVKNIAARWLSGDQFALTISGPGTTAPTNTATTSGTTLGIQTQQVGPLTVERGEEYTFSESAAATTALADYVTTYSCVDSTAGNDVVASGTGAVVRYAPTAGQAIVCTFANTAREAVLSTLTVQKNIVGRAFTNDQFVLSAAGADITTATATTTGSATGVQAAKAGPVSITPGTTYAISESADGATDMDFYTKTWQCVDSLNAATVVGSGTGVTGSFVAPEGADIVCTFANSPIAPEVSLSKTPRETVAVRGGTVTYEVVVTNIGTVHANGYTVTDEIPAGLTSFSWTCSATGGAACDASSGAGAIDQVISTLPVGGRVTYTVVASVAEDAPPEIINVGEFSIPSCYVDGVLVTPCLDDPLLPVPAMLSVLKDVTGRVRVGDQFILTATGGTLSAATATTTGAATGIQTERIANRLVAEGTRYVFGENGASTTDMSFYDASWECLDLANSNVVISSGTGRTGAVTVPAAGASPANIQCTITNDPIDGAMSIRKVANQAVAVPGEGASYTITMINTGRIHLNGTQLSDPVPDGLKDLTWSCTAVDGAVCPNVAGSGAILETVATFPAGSKLTYAVLATVAADAPAIILNAARILVPPPVCVDDDPDDALDCGSRPPLPLAPTISIDKTTSNTVVTPNGIVNYSVAVTNTGVRDANGTTISDPIPTGLTEFTSWSCTATGGAVCPAASGTGAIAQTIATFPVGSIVTYAIVAKAVANPPAVVTNVASANPPVTGRCTPGFTAGPCVDQVSISPQPVVGILKTADQPYFERSGQIVYTVVASNQGVMPADGTVITDLIPAGIASFDSWTCAATGGAVCPTVSGTGAITATVATFPVGGTLVYTITATVSATPPAHIQNTAQASPPGVCAPLLTAPPCSSTVDVPGEFPTVSVKKTANRDGVAVGELIVYSVVVTNTGLVQAGGTVVTDEVPRGLLPFDWTCRATGGAECAAIAGKGSINEVLAVFPAGSVVTYTVRATVTPNPPVMITNTAVILPPGECTPNGEPDPCRSTVNTPPPALALTGLAVDSPLKVALAMLVIGAGLMAVTLVMRRRRPRHAL